MSDEQQARHDFDQGAKQPFGSFTYQDTYRRLEQERARTSEPLAWGGQGNAASGEAAGTLSGGAALLPILVLVVVGAAILNDRHVQATIVGVATLLFLAALVALITRRFVAWTATSGANQPGLLFLSLVNAAIALFHGGLFAWLRDTIPNLRPRESTAAAATFVIDTIAAAAQIVQALLAPAGLRLSARADVATTSSPGATAYLLAACLILLLPALVYALAIRRATGFRRGFGVALPVQALLFVASIYALALLRAKLGLGIFT